MSQTRDYYHYTTEAGRKGITDSGYIMESTTLDDGDDARFGQGVYLTTVPPSRGKKEIIETCWGPNQFPAFVRSGRVDHVIRISIPQNRVKKATKKREVYLHKGILYLKDYDWDASKVPDKH